MQLKNEYKRLSGVLLSVTMLHGPFGIGVLGDEAYEFIDFMKNCGFRVWQVLPVEHTGFGFSPYNCVSAFAGEPTLIDPRELLNLGLISDAELAERCEGLQEGRIDYETVHKKQWKLLRTAYSRLNGWLIEGSHEQQCNQPCEASHKKLHEGFDPLWLDDYSLYMALSHHYGETPWYDWPDESLREYDAAALNKAREEFKEEIDFYKFVQWLFHKQWFKLKEYASERGISIIGDIPFYVAEESADIWSRRNLVNKKSVGGAPPDYFTPDGQCWGYPVYNWKAMKEDGYEWWTSRMREAISRYDIVRLDHFRGFESYWSIPATTPDAKLGKWVKGPGYSLFKAMEAVLGELPVIAEDLGDIDDEVELLLKRTGFRGMKVVQFGFMGDDWHIPHNFDERCVAYTSTHDSTTLLAWLFGLMDEDRERALLYLGFEGDWTVGGPNCAINRAWIRNLLMSRASLVVIPIQDLLGYGADTRTNIPGTAEGNWEFRIRPGVLDEIDTEFYHALNEVYGRHGEETET